MTKLKSIAKKFVIVGLIIYLVIFALLYAFQRNFLFHPDMRPIAPANAGLPDFKAVEVADGLKSWWHPPGSPNAPVILYLHGNGGALGGRSGIFAEMARWGAGVLAVGYPGYGGNAGTPSEASILKAAQANYDWLAENRIAPTRIVITAHSMGTGAAVPLAARNKAAGLILESPFTSMAEVAQLQMWMFPVEHLVEDPFRSIEHIRDVRMPVVWMHGTDDRLIPYEMGERLFKMVSGPKCYLQIGGGDHDHLWDMGVGAFTRRQAEAMVKTGGCDGSPVLLRNGELLPG